MAVQQWSESVLLADLADDPQFSEDVTALVEQCGQHPRCDVLLNFAAVTYLNSSNIAKLLKLRKVVQIANGRRLKLAGISRHVWGLFLVTGLDRIFDTVEDVPSGLALLQMSQ